MPLHIGTSGTRIGLSERQIYRMGIEIFSRFSADDGGMVFHHGDCVGADAQIDKLVREMARRHRRIIAHPGPPSAWSANCAVDERREVKPFMVRNADIVAESDVMLAAPYEDEPQPRGGTWGTIRIALRALRKGTLRELVVVGRNGDVLDHSRWWS